jgi:flagellar biosynthesis/type III secretory pathway chaperone
MIEPLMVAARRLLDALRAENEALARLDLATAGELGQAKRQAADAFAAAFAAAQRSGTRAEGAERSRAEEVALRLRDLTAENRRLLERAIELQSRVIETIAGAAKPPGPGTYGARGRAREARGGAVSVLSRV